MESARVAHDERQWRENLMTFHMGARLVPVLPSALSVAPQAAPTESQSLPARHGVRTDPAYQARACLRSEALVSVHQGRVIML